MVGVTIHTGPIDETSDSLNTDKDKWPELLKYRRDYIRLNFGYDCRQIVDWMHDSDRMWKPLGYASLGEMVRRELEIDPADVDLVVTWLKKYRPNQPVSLPEALSMARIQKATTELAENATPLKEQGDRGNGKKDYNCNLFSGSESGNDSEYLTARIARDRPDILERMKAGEYRSVRSAAIDAGIIDPEKTKRYQLPTDPTKAGKYLAERVDAEWMLACYDAFMKASE